MLWACRTVCGRNETIAAFGQGLDETGSVGRIAKRFPKLVDGLVQAVVKVNKRICGPKFIAKFLAGDDLAGALDEESQ